MIKNIVFAGTPPIAATLLEELINNGYNIISCLTRPDQPKGRNLICTSSAVKDLAIKYNIPVLQPAKLTNTTIDHITALQPDIMIVFAYGLILPPQLLAVPKLGCFNVHTSLLPKFRGAAPIQHTIISGDEIAGISIIKISAELDSGDICYQQTCSVDTRETTASLYQKLQPIAVQSTINFLQRIANNSLQYYQQDHTKATYAKKINKIDGKINWSLPACHLDRMIRAFIPYPVAFTEMAGMHIRIWEAVAIQQPSTNNPSTSAQQTTEANTNNPNAVTIDNSNSKYASNQPGVISKFNKHNLEVLTGDGILSLQKLQFPGSKILTPTDLFNANKYHKFLLQQQKFS